MCVCVCVCVCVSAAFVNANLRLSHLNFIVCMQITLHAELCRQTRNSGSDNGKHFILFYLNSAWNGMAAMNVCPENYGKRN